MATRKSNKATSKKAAPAKKAVKHPPTPKKDQSKPTRKAAPAKKATDTTSRTSKGARVSGAKRVEPRPNKVTGVSKGRLRGPASKDDREQAAHSGEAVMARGRGASKAARGNSKVRGRTIDVAESVGDEIESVVEPERDSLASDPYAEGIAEIGEAPEDEPSERGKPDDDDEEGREPAFEYEANEAGDESLLEMGEPQHHSPLGDAPQSAELESPLEASGEAELEEEAPISEPPNSENRLRTNEGEPADGDGSSDAPVMVIADDILDGEADTADTGTLLRSAIEALLFVAEKPVSIKDLAKALQLDKKRTQELLDELRAEYANRGIRIEEIADGYAFRTHPKIAEYARAFLEQRPVKLSRAQLETLAIVAYRQPITRPEVDDIRGVDCGPVLKGLLERELVRILGKKDEPGRPMLYGTTPAFLELFGLKSLQELPTLREFAELSEDSRRKYEDTIGEDAPPGLADLGLDPDTDVSGQSTDDGAVPSTPDSLTLDGLLEAAESTEFTDGELNEMTGEKEHPNATSVAPDEMDECQAADEDDDEESEDEDDDEESEDEDDDEESEDEDDEDEGADDDEDDDEESEESEDEDEDEDEEDDDEEDDEESEDEEDDDEESEESEDENDEDEDEDDEDDDEEDDEESEDEESEDEEDDEEDDDDEESEDEKR